jgi:hypothetical protein
MWAGKFEEAKFFFLFKANFSSIDNSIVNPNYLPGGKTKDTKSESRNPADKMKDEIRNTFK